MRVRESTYTRLGYTVTYEKREKYRGFQGPLLDVCHATKDGKKFVAIRTPDSYQKIMQIQASIPHVAQYSEPAGGHILMDHAVGDLVWHLNSAPTAISEIERQLLEFANGARSNGIIHRDVRPWNVFMDDDRKITVIDWGNNQLADNDLDIEDTKRLVRLLRGEITFQEAWGWTPGWYPAWCKHR